MESKYDASATLIRSVLTAIPIYQLIALEFPKWVIKAVGKIRRAFLWKGRKEANGGHCIVAWERVKTLIFFSDMQESCVYLYYRERKGIEAPYKATSMPRL